MSWESHKVCKPSSSMTIWYSSGALVYGTFIEWVYRRIVGCPLDRWEGGGVVTTVITTLSDRVYICESIEMVDLLIHILRLVLCKCVVWFFGQCKNYTTECLVILFVLHVICWNHNMLVDISMSLVIYWNILQYIMKP